MGIQLAVWEGEGKTILCVHGLTANCRCWDPVASSLAPAHRVIGMDLRGRGLSGQPEKGYSLQHHVGDIQCLLDDLALDRVVLMGHSLGAFISLAFAALHPERTEALILMDGGGMLTPEQLDLVALAIKPSLDRLGKVFPTFEAYIESLKKTPYLQPWSDAIENYFRYEVEAVGSGIRSRINPVHIVEEIGNLRKEKPAEYYPRISCPVLVVRATEGILSQEDLVLPESAVQRMISEIPHARRVDLTGANHFSLLMQPNPERDQAILNFLS